MSMRTAARPRSPLHRNEPQGPRGPARRRRSAPWSTIAVCFLLLYPLTALVFVPEGSKPFATRGATLALIAVASGIVIATARWTPGWIRGVAMLVGGSAGIVVTCGAVAKRVTTDIGVREITGILFGVASVMIFVIGWRRVLHGIHRSWVRAVVAVVGSILLAQLVWLPAVFAVDVTNRVRPQASGRTPSDLGLTYRDVRITSSDGIRLAAWWIPSRNGAAVIVLPGAGSTRDDALDHAGLVGREGYGALVLDWRGHGASEGRGNEFGWGADEDVRAAVSWVVAQPGVIEGVGLLGLSMGGEVAVTVAADDPRVDAVVAEGVSVRTLDDARQRSTEWAIPLENDVVMFGLVGLLGSPSPPQPLLDAFERIGDRPVLLIAGNEPAEAELGPVYASAAPETVTLWSLPDTGHIQGLTTHPDEYRTRVLSLFGRALLPPERSASS